jgi:membrane protease subunit HflK
MSDHPHSHHPPGPPTPPPISAADAGSQALSEALRSSFAIVKAVMVLLLLVFLASGFFTVGPQERAIKLRLGKPVGEGEKALLLPGLHWSYPYPIDEYVKVSISGIQKVTSTVGWYAITPEQELAGTEPPMGGGLYPGIDGYTLTGDNNIIHTRATVTYRIEDPVRYVFGFVDASNAVQSALDNALLLASSRYKVDNVLRRDVIGFSEMVKKRLVELVDQDRLGIQVEQCTVQSIPPRQVKDAFASVLKAEVNRDKLLVEARSYEVQTLSKASADSASRINTAKSDRARLVAEVSSRADQFQQLLPKYRQNPNLFVQQRLTETIGRVMTNAQDKIFVPESVDGKSRELRYLFNREMRIKTEEPKR